MIRIITFLILVAAIAFGINWIIENNGTVEFIWLGYQVNTTVAFFIFALTAAVIALILTLQILHSIISLPKKINKKYKNLQLEHNLNNLQRGYAAMLSGDYETAKKISIKLTTTTHKNLAMENLTLMLSAKIAQEDGNLDAANDYFVKFMSDKKNNFFAVKGLLDSAFKKGDIDDAIKYAEAAYNLKPNVKNGAHSLLELYKKAGRYDMAEDFLARYKRRHRLFRDKYNNIDIKKEYGLLWFTQAKNIYENSEGFKEDYERAKKYLEKCLAENPDDKQAIILMLKICKILKNEKLARNVISKAWPNLQSYDMGIAYLDILSSQNYKDSTRKKLKAIELLQKISPNHEITDKLKDKIYDVKIEY